MRASHYAKFTPEKRQALREYWREAQCKHRAKLSPEDRKRIRERKRGRRLAGT
jgi:hypothetical protein